MPASEYIRRMRTFIGTDLLMMPGVAAVVFDREGRVLLHRRSDDGTWCLPSGAMDPGESPAAACARETLEETGLEVRPDRLLGVFALRHRYPNDDLVEYLVAVFRCQIVGGTLEARDGESTGFWWATREELREIPLPYPTAIFDPEAIGLFEDYNRSA